MRQPRAGEQTSGCYQLDLGEPMRASNAISSYPNDFGSEQRRCELPRDFRSVHRKQQTIILAAMQEPGPRASIPFLRSALRVTETDREGLQPTYNACSRALAGTAQMH